MRLDLGLEQGPQPHPTPTGHGPGPGLKAVRNQQELHLPLSLAFQYYHLILPPPHHCCKKIISHKTKGLETTGLQDRGNRARGKGVAMGGGTAGHSVWLGHGGGGGGGACRSKIRLAESWPWSWRAHIQSVCGGGALMKGEDEEQFDQICTLQRTL